MTDYPDRILAPVPQKPINTNPGLGLLLDLIAFWNSD